MQFHFYEIDYCISYKFEIIVMLLICIKQHSKNKFSVVFNLLECVIENYIKFYQREKMPKCLISLKFYFRCLCFCLCVISYRKNLYYLSGSQIVNDSQIRNSSHYFLSASYQIPVFFSFICSSNFTVTNRKTEVGISSS